MSFQPKRRWFQFSLRALMAASFVIALFLGWWFRPFVIETHRPDGSLRRRFTVCRDWRGGLVSHGKQVFVFHDGARFEATSFGLPLDKEEFDSLLLPEHRFESLIDLIIETIEPESWSGRVNINSLKRGSGQVAASDEGSSR